MDKIYDYDDTLWMFECDVCGEEIEEYLDECPYCGDIKE